MTSTSPGVHHANSAYRVCRSIYRTSDESIRADLSSDEMAEVLAGGLGLLWVDIHEWDAANVALLRDVFKFHPLAIEDCFNDRVDTAKIDDFGNHLFIVSQSVLYASRAERLRVVELGLFVGANYVVTVHQRVLPMLDEVFSRAAQMGHHMERGASFLTHAILDGIVDELLPTVEAMDEQLDTLERRILADPVRTQLQDALLLKRNALRMRRAIISQRDMVNRISRGDFPAVIVPEALIFYRDIHDHILRVEAMIDGLRDLAEGALSSYLSSVNNRMNEVMKAMSVVAVIFLPLTLIASIFGTNLEYRFLGAHYSQQHGFVLMLVMMVLVAGGLIAYFRSQRWF